MISNHRIIITPGEPAGIGPDIIIKLAQKKWPVELVVCASPKLLYDRAYQLRLPINLYFYDPNNINKNRQSSSLAIIPIKLSNPVIPGKLSKDNSKYVIKTLIKSCYECIEGRFQAIVTGPVNKYIINDAGISFTGHTELFARLTFTEKVVMMLVNEKLRVALVTTHVPLKSVPDFITKNNLYKIINILHQELKKKFSINNPAIYICGLNPHAGDKGYIGKEEIEIIIPVINELRKKGLKLIGPLPADTIFQENFLKKADVILAMYHDQGLPVLKFSGFNKSVNVTLGLPFIRTSVDHGTALEIASKGTANPESLFMAVNLAINMIEKTNE
ncbi:4-hydroxythreonine-4-phosphate dehydrogenase PdxA [Pantoea sp. SoEX]|uniref:4-hydroxythreonine-4-phosphate dehydrogenase PdxA n=1 Tax=Pantoea sp. SoEX TaxID=2576763 RepID=UPI00135CDEE3|nr:4-hydroxythreonine-4-phosphate dehydrogenase PdxA [Pantoea sp. SoEX]MXP51135.1 4-hydroxythreonine-4-phosphate dehydrogenase PdxA [Pantoea sp. SoEX]